MHVLISIKIWLKVLEKGWYFPLLIINDNIEVLQEELKRENPRKGFVRTAINGLQGVSPKIAGAVELTAAVTNIIQFAIMVL
ncbi:hypothetical protein [Alkaliphilus metalliredigens]|nr:hypothetical protein [Alkaliphilus metalliredigens]